jgi:cytochrome c biogenesis protein CcmG, thiol:disulfide interchange protein DsbE
MSDPATPAAPSRPQLLRLLPVVIFLALAALFAYGLTGDPQKLPSTLIGKPAPRLALAPLEGLMQAGRPVPGLVDTDLVAAGTPSVVNFWASWCAPCVAEHPLLIELARQTGVRLVGINHKDSAANARRFLGRYGNPFERVAVDSDGRAAIEWGVYGMPETFVIDGRGAIVFKHVGQITAETLRRDLIPAIQRAQAQR